MKSLNLRLLLTLLPVLISFGCQTPRPDSSASDAAASDNTKVATTRSFDEKIDRYSAGDVEYNGLYNNFEYKATLLNSYVREAQITKRAEYYQWNESQTSIEREKSNQEMSSQTKVFMAFFTPNAKNDNLVEDKSIWKLYLDASGRRYEGKVKRIRTLLAEQQSLFPFMTRWATPYEITFDVPTSAIERGPSVFTVTGPLGARAVNFNAL